MSLKLLIIRIFIVNGIVFGFFASMLIYAIGTIGIISGSLLFYIIHKVGHFIDKNLLSSDDNLLLRQSIYII